MQAGTLKNKVTIKQLTEGQDEIGQPMTTWADVATVWANIRNLSGIESIKAGADTSIVKASIRIRMRNDINAGMRVFYGAKEYDIKAVLPDEQAKDKMDLSCELVNG